MGILHLQIKIKLQTENKIHQDKTLKISSTGWRKKVLLFDKSLNNGLLFYCLNILGSDCLFMNLDFDTSTIQIQ